MTQQTFPLPISEESARGFTFLEVLIALLIVTMAIGVTAGAAVQVIHSEQAASDLRDAALHLQTLACRTYLHDKEDGSVDGGLSGGWQSAHEEKVTANNEQETFWTTWSIRPRKGRASRSYTLSFRNRATPSE
jgi:prepilin-type N-terminal cleavage/methylation domain-containing protein